MSRRRKKSTASAIRPEAASHDKPTRATAPHVNGWKLWLFRLLALVAGPAIFFGLVELALRLCGFGYPTEFLLPASHSGQQSFVQNNQFGWRFFGPKLARLPYPFSISQQKGSNTVRIFVFGESAAKGDPQPKFGLPRLLQAMLSLRHPGVRFEVVNTAMTAINSHAILPIARDCAEAGGDVWVIYMGNNEVVGPFGAGTIFGSQTPPLPFIRGSIALKASRTGQWLDSAIRRVKKPSSEETEWGGMKMFLDQQVRADDPRMNDVYHHFERNLADILKAGRNSGVGIVVSTVAVNLKDCAPFASSHRPGLSDPDKAGWEQLYQSGIKAQDSGNNQEAAEKFREAAQIDDTFAELRFRQGMCALALGKTSEAQQHLRAARDLDTLRFRCDSRLDDLTRRTASNRELERILLADAERVFAEASPVALAGEDLFYEHVHLNFDGNYLLARTIAAQVEKLLPERAVTRTDANQPWPSKTDCARRLAWTGWNEQATLNEVFSRLTKLPFTGQLNHKEQMQRVKASLEKLSAANHAAPSEARRVCEEALLAAPDDPWLHGQLASLKQLAGDLAGAAASVRRELELLPSDSEGWWQLGLVLAQQQQFEEASAAFRRAFQLDPQDIWSLQNLAQMLAVLGRHEDAIREYRRALAINPDFGGAWVGLGQVFEQTGREAEAKDCYQKALANGVRRASDLVMLAGFFQSLGWLEAAATNYASAIELSPVNAKLRVKAGQNLASLSRFTEAAEQLREAVRLEPGMAEARFLYGSILGQQGVAVEAENQFREALRLEPELLEARLNLGIALMSQGRDADALTHLEEVLQRSPTNALALRYAQSLRAKLRSGQ